jgi:hypothetical protein
MSQYHRSAPELSAVLTRRVEPSNDNSRSDLRVLEARFHPQGRSGDFIVIGKILCRPPNAMLEVASDFKTRVPARLSERSIVSNLGYLTLMSRPRPVEFLLSLENRYWSFVLAGSHADQVSH